MNEETAPPMGSGGGKGMSVAALILGLVAFVPGICCGIVGIPCAVLAIILGAVGRKRGQGGMATAGIALGIIYLILAVVIFVGGFEVPGSEYMKNMQSEMGSDTSGGSNDFDNDGDNNNGNDDTGNNDGDS